MNTEIIALDETDVTAVGYCLRGARRPDIVDAHVVVCAERNGQVVVTSDPGHLEGLSAGLWWLFRNGMDNCVLDNCV